MRRSLNLILSATRVNVVSTLVLVVLSFLAQPAAADYIQPEQVSIKTESYVPRDTNFDFGTYDYAVNWQGIPVAKSSVAVIPGRTENGVKTITVRATVETSSVIALFYKLKHVSESVFRADSMAPIIFSSVQTENSRTKSREVRFGNEGQISSTLWSWKTGAAVPEEQHDFKSENTTVDPITATFLARSLEVNEGQEVGFDVFNGKHRFLITLKRGATEKVKVNRIVQEAFRVTPGVKKLTDTEGEKRLREATIWVSTDGRRNILKLESKVFVGAVRAELIRFTPSTPSPGEQGTPPTGSVRAALQAPAATESKGESK